MAYNGVEWIPGLIKFQDFNNAEKKYINALYGYFSKDFKISCPTINGQQIGISKELGSDGREAVFGHIISRDGTNKIRVLDYNRCERIKWPKSIINNYRKPEIKCFSTTTKGHQRIHLWFEILDYVVIIEEVYSRKQNKYYYLLITAFCVDQNHTKKKFNNQYNDFKKDNAALFKTAP